MPKQKSKKTILKRFKVSSSGKVFRGHQMSSHRKSHKSKRLRRSYKKNVELTRKQSVVIKKLMLK